MQRYVVITTIGSHPTWVRGLKPYPVEKPLSRWEVAPHVGAWIETSHCKRVSDPMRSHPTWVRGLKQRNHHAACAAVPVAPHVGAWIETSRMVMCMVLSPVAPHVGAWIETII